VFHPLPSSFANSTFRCRASGNANNSFISELTNRWCALEPEGAPVSDCRTPARQAKSLRHSLDSRTITESDPDVLR
jgi:hypothetical protein